MIRRLVGVSVTELASHNIAPARPVAMISTGIPYLPSERLLYGDAYLRH
jgi:hypothetical protein